jgi:hypothetical protein
MKLRIKGDSLRLRLTQGEVKQLGERGEVEERTHFGAGTELVYRLKRDSGAKVLNAVSAGAEIEVRVPVALANQWCSSDQEGISATQTVSPGVELRIAVEKDYACLTVREGEDESDNYPHPAAEAGKTC